MRSTFALTPTLVAALAGPVRAANAQDSLRARPDSLPEPSRPSVTEAVRPRRADLERLYATLRQPPRSAYETTKAFEERSGRPVSGRYAVTIPRACGVHDNWWAGYAADSQAVRVTVVAGRVPGLYEEGGGGSGWDTDHVLLYGACQTTGGGRYVGTNAFGVRQVVYRGRYREYALMMPDSGWALGDMKRYVRVYIPATPAEAKRLLPQLAVRVDFAVRPVTGAGPTARMVDERSPTMEAPVDYASQNQLVRAGDVAITIYNKVTGVDVRTVRVP